MANLPAPAESRADAGRAAPRDAGQEAWIALALATLGHASGAFSVLAVAPLSPFLLEALALSRAQVGLLVPAAYLGGVLMSLPSGWLTDRLGVRLTFGAGLAFLAFFIGAAAFVNELPALFAALVLAGFGFSVLNPATGKAIVDWFPPRRRGAAMGVKQTGLTLGGIGASLALPPVAVAFGWRTALLVAAGISLAMAVLVLVRYRAAPAPLPRAPARSAGLHELAPYLRRPGMMLVFACGFLLSIAQSSLLAYLVLYATETYAVSRVGAGQLLALAQVGGTISRFAWGFVSDRFFGSRRRPGIVISATLGTLAYALLALGDRLPAELLVPIAVVAGAGAFGWVGLYFALVAEVGGPRHAGLLTGVSVSFSWSGVLVGPPLFGLVLEATASYAVPWIALAVIAAAVAMILPRPQPLVQRD